nr:hypothetical protein [Tanacetum cinerariifolium]
MFYQKNVDYVAFLWEDFMFQADNREISFARKDNMPYLRFTKVIITHFISKDKTISMRNKISLHTIHDDTMLGTLKFVSKTEDYQKYGALIPEEIINQAIKVSKAYKIYLNFTTGKDTTKKAKKFIKIASPSQKLTTVLKEEPVKKPKRAKKPKPTKQAKTTKKTALAKSSTMQTAGVVIKDTPGVSVSKKKAKAKVDRGNCMDLLSNDTEPVNKAKGDVEVIVVGQVNVNQEGACSQVKDDAPATHKTKEATTSTTVVPDSETLSTFHQRIANLEKDVKDLKTVDHSATLLSTIKSEVSNAINEYLGKSLDDALYKVLKKHDADIIKEHSALAAIQEPKETITSFDTTTLEEFDQKANFFETMTKSKSFNKSPKQRALYHALMDSIQKDEDAMDEGVADKLKKMKQDDADKDEGPFAGSNRGLKRWKTSKDTEPSKNAKLNETSKGTLKSQPKYSIMFAKQRRQDVIFDLGVALRMFTRHVIILKQVEDLQLGIKSYQKKLNITKPETFKSDISNRTPYTAYINPQGIIYVDKYKRYRLMRLDKLYKFSNRTLTSVRTILYDIASNQRMYYLSKRRWSNLDTQRSRIIIKAIDKLLLEGRLMRSLEKFVGKRDYGEDFRVPEWTI